MTVAAPGFVAVAPVRSPADRAAWDRLVVEAADASPYHRLSVLEGLARSLGHRTYALLAWREGRAVAALPLVEQRSLLFGRSLSSLPALNYGGIAGGDLDAREALLATAIGIARSVGATHVELRHAADDLPGVPSRTHKVSMRLPLPESAAHLWKGFRDKVRNQVRKAERAGLRCVPAGPGGLDAFYEVFAENMRDLGTPVYALRFFEEMLAALPGATEVFHVLDGSRPVAASIVVGFRDRLEVPWAAARAAARPLCANHLLYRTMLDWAIERGHRTFDFGRTTPGSGPHHFKAQWGAQPHPLYWHYWLPQGVEAPPDRSPASARFRRAIALWKRLPVSLTKLLGPPIARALP